MNSCTVNACLLLPFCFLFGAIECWVICDHVLLLSDSRCQFTKLADMNFQTKTLIN